VSEPAVSALIPVHDGEEFLGAALESVLAQTHAPAEVVVVDNASSDRSVEIAREFGDPVRVVEEPRPGILLARNACLEAASGEYFAFLDHDDLWEPTKTELQLAAFAADPGLDLVLGQIVQFTDGIDDERAARIRIPHGPQPGRHLNTVLAPRATWERIGPWDPGSGVADGLVWFIRVAELGMRQRMLDEVVARRRIHRGNRSFDNHADRGEWIQVLKASLDGRREQSR